MVSKTYKTCTIFNLINHDKKSIVNEQLSEAKKYWEIDYFTAQKIYTTNH